MAILTPAQLQASNNATYTTNGSGSITGASANSFNANFISSSITVSQTGSMTVLSASYAATASYLLGSIVSASYALSSSYALNATTANSVTSASYALSSSYAVSASYAPAAATFPYVGNATITGSLTISGSAYGNVIAVSVSSNTASINLQAGNFFTVTLGNSATTYFNVLNPLPGLSANIVVTTGTNSTASFSSNVKQPSGSAYLPSSGSGVIDALSLATVDSSNVYLVASKKFV